MTKKPMKILRLPEVRERLSLSESSLDKLIAAGKLRTITLTEGGRIRGVLEEEVDAYIQSRIDASSRA
jgi:predicted DNA-binding transcriptional regulator AlpA